VEPRFWIPGYLPYSNVKEVLCVCWIVEPTRSGLGSGEREREPDVVQRICKGVRGACLFYINK
jgi:hypothetical protein